MCDMCYGRGGEGEREVWKKVRKEDSMDGCLKTTT
jgi:hypothetical protein